MMGNITLDNSETNESRSFYVRDESVSDEALHAAYDAYTKLGKQSFDPSNPQSIMVLPNEVKSVKDMASHGAAMYDEYIAQPVGKAVNSITSSPVVNRAIDLSIGNTSKQSSVKALGDYVKSTMDDPVTGIATLASAPLGAASQSVIRLAPAIMQRTLQLFGLPAALGTATGALDTLFNPNASPGSSMVKAGIVAGSAFVLQTVFHGWNKMLGNQEMAANAAATAQADNETAIAAKLAAEQDHNDLVSGFTKIWDKYGIDPSALQRNPKAYIKQLDNVAQEIAERRFNKSLDKMLEYIGINSKENPEIVKSFSSNISKVRSNLDALATLEPGSAKYISTYKDLLKNLDATKESVLGINAKGYPLTVPNDTMMAYYLSKDPEFLRVMNSTMPMPKSESNFERYLSRTDPTTQQPMWKSYATARDIQRVSDTMQGISTSLQDQASQRRDISIHNIALDKWKDNIKGLVTQINDINQSKAITAAALSGDITDTTAIRNNALKTVQNFTKLNKETQSLVDSLYASGNAAIPELSLKTPAQVYKSKNTNNLTPLQLSITGPINSSVLKSLRDHR